MDSNKVEVDFEFLPYLRVYNDGRVERLKGPDLVPSSMDSEPTVSSKDVTINTQTGLCARLYIPKNITKDKKLPVFIYFHGGAFLIESAFSLLYHNYLNSAAEEANMVVVSVEYRLAPENPVPTAYEDSWEAIEWVASHSKGQGQEPWLRECVNFDRVFLGGDSAGANIVHTMAMRAKEVALPNDLKLYGIILAHPYFWGEEPIGSEGSNLDTKAFIDKMWVYACPSTTGSDDPRINPVVVGAPSLCNLGCTRVLVFIAGEDVLRDRGLLYHETLKNSGWEGVADVIEIVSEGHVFHLLNPTCDEAISMMKSLASFINQDNTRT